MNALRKTLPVWISIGLIVWLIYRVSLDDLLRAAARLPWQVLAPMTAAVVIVMYFWDVVCLLTVFAGNGKAVTYSQMLHLRGASYLVGAFNQGLGQAALAWDVARFQGTSFIAALSRSVLLGWHEGVVLAAVALAGSLWTDRPEVAHIRSLCIVLLLFRLAIGLTWLWCGERFERHAVEVRQ